MRLFIMNRILALSLLSAVASLNCVAETIHMKKGESRIIEFRNPYTADYWKLEGLDNKENLQAQELIFKRVFPASTQDNKQSWKITATQKGFNRAVFQLISEWGEFISSRTFDFIIE